MLGSNVQFIRIVLFFIISSYSFSSAFGAPAVTEDVQLDFGSIAITANDVISTETISPSGSIVYNNKFVGIGGAVRGEYRMTGFPAYVTLETTLFDTNLTPGGTGSGEPLLVTDFNVPNVTTDANGEATVYVGASLKSSGSTVMYTDAPYTSFGTPSIHVRYWSDADENFITHVDSVEYFAQVQTTISLAETQELSFGTLSAYSDPIDTASFKLNTNGDVDNITSSGNARLTPLFGATRGVIQVSGAAPYYNLTITPEAGSIYLNYVPAGDVARFIVNNFTTQPATTGQTDANGDLQIFVGATIQTEAVNKSYQNGSYTGTYTLTVTY